MVLTDLQGIAQSVLNRAQRNGYVLPREIQKELTEAGLDKGRMKDVLELTQTRLKLRKGRYYYVSPLTARVRQEHHHRLEVDRAVRQLIRRYKASAVDIERRAHRRLHFIHPVKVFTSTHRELHLVSQDISLTGIRLLGTCDLRGQKVRVQIPSTDKGCGQWSFTVQILWSSNVGDDLIENGGIILELHEGE